MQKIIIFFIGAAVGGLASYFYVAPSSDDAIVVPDSSNSRVLVNSSENASLAAAQGLKSGASEAELAKPAGFNAPVPQVEKAEVDYLIKAFQLNTDNPYGSNEFKDLAYLVRHSKSVAEQVRNRIIQSQSYDERMSLVAVLAGDESQETLDFATTLVQSVDGDSQNLGYELLLSMGDRANTPVVNAILLDAISYESSPQSIGNIINLLSVGTLDESTKAKAGESFQRLVSRGESTIVTARAIDGLSRVGSQDAIYLAVVDHLSDPDPDVKTAAISAINALDKSKITQEMIEVLKDLAGDASEQSIVREYATMILDGL